MPKRLLPVLERALRKFEGDTGVRPRKVYVTPAQRDKLIKEIGGAPGGHLTEILGVQVVVDHAPKVARIRALLAEREVAWVETGRRPGGGPEAYVRAFGRVLIVHLPVPRYIFRYGEQPEPSMSPEQVLDAAAPLFAETVDDRDLLREEVRLRPRPSIWMAAAHGRSLREDAISTTRLWSTQNTQQMAAAMFANQPVISSMAAAMFATGQTVTSSAALAVLGLTESATARQGTSAGTPESPPPTLRSTSPGR